MTELNIGFKRVAIVVLNWNGWRDTLACVASLQKLNYPNVQLIVVDNGSTDGSQVHIASHLPDVQFIQTGKNLGYGGGCNAGIRLAMEQGADYVWLVNNDATVDPLALTEMVHMADVQVEIGAVGSVLYDANQPEQIQLWGGGKVRFWSGTAHHRVGPAEIDYVSGASMLLRRQAIERVGMFDDQTYFMYWEDTDLGFRLRCAGWLLVVAEKSRVWHKLSASLGRGSHQIDKYFTCSGIRFFRRHSPMAGMSVVMMVGRMLLKRMALGQFARAKSVLQGYMSA
jgi:GT2 family glycosyltransferase